MADESDSGGETGRSAALTAPQTELPFKISLQPQQPKKIRLQPRYQTASAISSRHAQTLFVTRRCETAQGHLRVSETQRAQTKPAKLKKQK